MLSCAKIFLLALSFQLLPPFPAIAATPDILPATSTNSSSVRGSLLVQGTNGLNPSSLQPGPDDGRIAFLTAKLLEQYHYSHHPFDDSISSQFLDRYLESLDPQHLHFLQSDLNQFERYRTNLDNLTLTAKGVGDTSPAFVIFKRFMERLKERVAYADDLLKNEKFEFNTDERIAIDRREVPYPQDLEAAKVLWRQRLRFEYLQEKLALESKKDKPAITNSTETIEPEKPIHEQIVDTLTHRYNRTFRMFTDWNNDDVLGIYLTALTHVYDPHSDYFNKEALDGFKISMNLQLFGIGAQLRSEDGFCKIEQLLAGGPAIKSGKIVAGNYIVAVAQSNQPPVDVVDMSLTKVVQLIRGPKGTQVQLTLTPGAKSSKRSVVTLIRDEIPLEDQAAKGKIIELPNGKGGTTRLGVINLPSFYAPMMDAVAGTKKEVLGKYTSVDVAKLLTKFKQENVSGVILDLRYNGGGSLEEAIKLTGLFIKDGPVVQVKDEEKTQVDADTDPSITYDGPLVVLTSRFSASASEIVAGALQDYGRALIVGDISTHGKGTVQTVQSLKPWLRPADANADERAALKFTIKKFYRASGASTQLRGVMPDIVLPSRWNYSKDIGESSLENPLPWDTNAPAKFNKVNMVQPYLSELLKRSNERVATNQDFVYVREDIDEFRKQQADKTISLNEKLRVKEKDELEARQKAREKELLARKDPDEKVYELTLKQADLPGLPPPVQKTNSVVAVNPNLNLTGTNATVAVKAPPTDLTESDEDIDTGEKPPTVDANLNEAERILLDYLRLMPNAGSLIANQVGLKN